MSEYEYQGCELIQGVGSITDLGDKPCQERPRHPLGFAPGPPPRRRKGQRTPGTWPRVPRFDVQPRQRRP